MEIVLFESEGYADEVSHRLEINGRQVASIGSLCESPEDAIIGRSLIDGNQIIRFMLMAYNAGKAGEEFIVSYKDEDEY